MVNIVVDPDLSTMNSLQSSTIRLRMSTFQGYRSYQVKSSAQIAKVDGF